jgi:hypothetical protein
MNKRDDQEKLKMLKRDWNQLDELGEDPPAALVEIRKQLDALHEQQRKTFYKELKVFLTTAVFILTVIITSIVQQPVIFIGIQAAASILAPIVLYALMKRKRREGKVLS